MNHVSFPSDPPYAATVTPFYNPNLSMLMKVPMSDLSDDELIYFEGGARAQEQIALARRYLDAVNRDMSASTFARRAFVQLFAEPGLYRNRATQEWFIGAGLHAFTLMGFNHYIYTSLNHQVLGALEQRYQRYFARPHTQAHFMGGNCNDLARGIISETEFYILTRRGTRPLGGGGSFGAAQTALPVPAALTFCLYQSDVHLLWETVVAISRLPYVNLMVYYPIDALNRQMPQAQSQRGESDVDGFFGGKAWRDLYRRGLGQSRHEQLIPYYCERLKSLGFGEVVTELDFRLLPSIQDPETPNYFLIFAHKQPKGEAFWESVAAKKEVG